MKLHRITIAVSVIAMLVACDEAVDLAPTETSPKTLELQADHSEPEFLFDGERVVLERTGRNPTLAGELVKVRARTDAARVIVLDTYPEGFALEGQRVLDARTVGDGVVTLGADRVLRHHTENEVRVLDTEVLGPLSTEAGRVAYVRGEAPDLRLTLADLATGETESVAPALRPAWSPALSEDGREIAFAAVFEGRPHLFVRDHGGALHELNSAGRTPSSPIAPRWRGGVLSFDDEAGRVKVYVDRRTLVAAEGAQ